MKAASIKPLSVFYSYAHEDSALREALDKHLATLKRSGWIQSWSDRDICAGTEWQQEIDTHLCTADVILLLVSSDFLSSEYCYSLEVQEALRRHEAGEAVVIPIVLRPVDWHGTPFSSLQVLPVGGKPVTSWSNHDEAFEQIAQGIRRVVKTLRQVVFIASSPLDQPFVERLTQDLAARGVVIGDQGQVQLQDAPVQEETTRHVIRTASAVLLIASPEAPYSRMLQEHLKLATLLNRPMIVVWASGDDWDTSVPKGWSKQDAVDARGERYEGALTELIARLRSRLALSPFVIPASDTQEILSEPRNPYKGLRAFSCNDARDFFGRVSLIGELAEGLQASLVGEQRGNQGSRLLTVIGPSGLGKSSVVMAGLLPCLQSGGVLHSEEWVYLDPVLPGAHPLEALAVTLARELPQRSVLSLQQDLESDSLRVLHLLACQIARQPETKVVLLIDQFEELFTLTSSEEEREHFIDLLVTAVTEPRGPLVVILTLRADFYDRPMAYPPLSRIMQQHLVQVLPMRIQDLRAAIEQPALLPDVALTFEGDLVSHLLFEMHEQEGALPLLEFTLEQLFQRRQGHLLTLQAYDEIGGVKGALTKQAEDTYRTLPSEEHRQLARVLFLRLIEPGMTEQETTRRRIAPAELVLTDPQQTATLRETADAFIRARLLTTNEVASTSTIEVSHEALIREWGRLSAWMRAAREDIPLQQTLSKDVAEWERRGKPKDRLYRGSQLKEARIWAKRNIPSKSEVAFLRASVASGVRFLVSMIAVVLMVVSSMGGASWVLTHQPDPTLVSNLQDNDKPGSLHYAVDNAPAKSMITFSASLRGTILLSSGDLNIGKNLEIRGPGAGTLSISGGKSGHIVHVIQGISVTISGLTFKDSTTTENSIILNDGTLTLNNSTVSGNTGSRFGGGIYNSDTLTLINSTVSGNTAFEGGGIHNSGTLTLINSTVSGNTATDGGSDGGGIYNSHTLTLINSTVSGNTAPRFGGGIHNSDTLTLINSTVSGNTATDGGGIFIQSEFYASHAWVVAIAQADLTFSTIYGNTAHGGGDIAIEDIASSSNGDISKAVKQGSQVKIRNSIVAGDPAHPGPDIMGMLTSYGYNLFQDNSGATFDPATSTQQGTDKTLSANDMTRVFASPVVLRESGGPTKTYALLPGTSNPAMNKVPLDACQITISSRDTWGTLIAQYTLTTDQRGMKRPDGNEQFCDIGAYEVTE